MLHLLFNFIYYFILVFHLFFEGCDFFLFLLNYGLLSVKQRCLDKLFLDTFANREIALLSIEDGSEVVFTESLLIKLLFFLSDFVGLVILRRYQTHINLL